MDLMNEPPNIIIASDGITIALYGKTPREKYPMVNNKKDRIIAFRNPILSAKAPVNGGRKYNPAENTPPIHAAHISSKPTIVVRYKVTAMKNP